MTEAATSTIYCFVLKDADWGSDVAAQALADDGTVLAAHVSSSVSWAKRDIGLNSDRKHDLYSAHFPGGYTLEWVDDPDRHEGVRAARERAAA